MSSVKVYDPAMCCSTGVCGPEVDPALAQFAGDLDWLKGQGLSVQRFNLAQEPAEFVENAEVKAILDKSGDEELPVIVIDDKVVSSGRYPKREELAALAGLQGETAPFEMTDAVRALIALSAAIAASCEPCFKFHYDRTRKLGVAADAMREAVAIASGVKQASANNITGLADRMLGTGSPEGAASSCCSPGTSVTPAKGKSCC